jgi:hypothetical protein
MVVVETWFSSSVTVHMMLTMKARYTKVVQCNDSRKKVGVCVAEISKNNERLSFFDNVV